MSSSETATPTEQLLWKIIRGATAFKSAVEYWQQCQRRSASLLHHIHRCSVVAAGFQKASASATNFGSAAKMVGSVATAIGIISRVPSLTGLGCRIWKVGCAAKLAGMSGKALAEIWENGFKDTLMAYLNSVGGFLHNMTLVRTLLEEIEVLMPSEFETERFMPLLLLVCPEELFPYACHILKLFVSPQHYSAIYDFATMAFSSLSCEISVPLRMLHELESYHLLTVLDSMSRPLQLAIVAVHIGKEMMELAGNLRNLRNQDCTVIRRTLQKLKLVLISLGSSINKIHLLKCFQSENVSPSLQASRLSDPPVTS